MNDFNKDFQKEEVSIKELFFIIKRSIRKLYLSIICFIVFTAIYLTAIRPIYHTSGTIIIEDGNSSMSSIFDMGLGSDLNHLENEIEVLKSRTTIERTIQSLLNSEFKNNLHLFNTKEYENSFFQNIFRNLLFLDWNKKVIEDIDKNINDSLFTKFVENLRDDILISNLRNTDVLKVSYSSHDPYEAAFIVNTVIDVYKKRDQEWASGEMSHLKYFLSDQLIIKKDELNQIEQKLKTFQEQEHIYGLDDNSSLLLNQLTSVESDYYANQVKKNILSERKKYFEKQLNENEKEFTERVTNTLNTQLYSIRHELSILEAEFISTKSREGDAHPAVIDLNKKIKSLKKVLNSETKKYVKQGIYVANPIEYRQGIMDSVIHLNASISGYDSKLSELKDLVDKYESHLFLLPEKYLIFSRFQRDKVILDETYSLMKQKLEEVKISEASQLGKIRIVDSAKSNLEQSAPNKKFILILASFLGFSFGIGVILVTEFLDSTIKSIEEIERRGLPVLAIIPSIGDVDKKRKKKKGYRLNIGINNSEKIERRLLTHENPKSPISEAYRSLRTSLMFDDDKKNTKLILITSPGPGEGKTTTVANLAITYANMGRKTLLVDADLRKPVLNQMFKNDKNKGLTSFLTSSEENIDNLIFSSDVQNLSVITSGVVPPNPSELLSSSLMIDFIKQVKEKFDIVLFDSPPIIAVTDAFVMRKFMDKFLLVIRASVTNKGALERSLITSSNMEHSISGVVFNAADESNTYGTGYYYNYYKHYYGSGKKE